MINPGALGNGFVHPHPIYRVEVDGTDITATLQGRLIDLTLTDNRGFEADEVEIQIDDTDGLVDIPAKGVGLRAWIGWAQSGLIYKGSYTVDEIEHAGAPDILTLRARSADLRTGLTTQRERSWHDLTLGDIVTTLASENGLDAAIDGTMAVQPISHIDQTNESAVNLLTRLAGQFDAIATVKDGKLIFMPAAGGRSASGQAFPAALITRADGDRHRFLVADRDSYSGVRATYNDIRQSIKGEVIWGNTEDSSERETRPAKPGAPATGQYKSLPKPYKNRDAAQRAARQEWTRLKKNKAEKAAYVGVKAKYNDKNLSVSGEVAYGQAEEDKRRKSAVRLAERDREKLSERPEDLQDAGIASSAENIKTLRHVYSSKANALRAARAEWRRIQRGMASFSITLAYGRAELFPDIPIAVSGFKRAIDHTDWIATRVTHNLNDGGFTTTLELEIQATEVGD